MMCYSTRGSGGPFGVTLRFATFSISPALFYCEEVLDT